MDAGQPRGQQGHRGGPRRSACVQFLASLGGWLTFASAMAMTLIISGTTIVTVGLCGQHLRRGRRDPSTAVAGADHPAGLRGGLPTYACAAQLAAGCRQPTLLTLRSIKVAIISMLILAMAGSWLAMSLA